MIKQPVQARGKRTVDTILEATAQILQDEGEASLTTNRVAERAGFSIGTLYQYFPNKDAILVALANREAATIEARIASALATAEPGDAEFAMREIIRILIGAFSARRGVRKFILLTMLRRLKHDPSRPTMDAVAARIMDMLNGERGQGLRLLTSTGAFVLTRSIMGAIRAALIEESPLFETDEFQEELVRLAMNFLRDAR
jgi:AcrR family transcriptional regulator